jgi:ribA/ribD-fused uncharacterized protein
MSKKRKFDSTAEFMTNKRSSQISEEGTSMDRQTSEKVEFYEPSKLNGFLSNYFGQHNDRTFHLTAANRNWKSVEHYFQAQKFIFEGCSEKSLEYANLIADASTPNIAKELASQKIKGGYPWRTRLNPVIEEYSQTHKVHLRADWEKIKDEVMYEAVFQKFAQNKSLRDLLIGTKEKTLVEHTPRDKYWGDGGDGTGKNKLGETLMKVRVVLRSPVL